MYLDLTEEFAAMEANSVNADQVTGICCIIETPISVQFHINASRQEQINAAQAILINLLKVEQLTPDELTDIVLDSITASPPTFM